MASTYTLNNGIELIGTGEQSGTWGDTTNTNLELLDTALDGQVTVTLASAGTSGSPNTLAISDGAASDGRNRMVIFDDSSDLGATAYVQLTPNDAEKIIYVRNSLSGDRSILLFQGTYSASNDYELPAGNTAIIYFDGAGAGAVAANVMSSAHFDNLNIVGDVTIGDDLTLNSDGAIINIGADNDLQITHSGTEGTVTNATGNLTFDVAGDIVLDFDGGDLSLKDGGTERARLITGNAGYFDIYSPVSDQDVRIRGIDGASIVDAVTFDMSAAGAAIFNVGGVFNESGANSDFRVESDTNANALFVDASANAVGMGITSSPEAAASSEGLFYTIGGSFVVASNSETVKINRNGTGGNNRVNLGLYNNGTKRGEIGTYGAADGMYFFIGSSSTDAMRLQESDVVFNQAGADRDFRVESDANANMLYVDAGNSRIGVGKGSPSFTFDVEGVIASAHYMRVDSNSGVNGSSLLTLKRDGNTAGDYLQMRDGSNNLFATFDEGGIIFNEQGGDTDFRVESDTNANALFVDAGASKVKINTTLGGVNNTKNLVVGDGLADGNTYSTGDWEKIAVFLPNDNNAGSDAGFVIGGASYGTSGTETLRLQFSNTHGNTGRPVGWHIRSTTDLDPNNYNQSLLFDKVTRSASGNPTISSVFELNAFDTVVNQYSYDRDFRVESNDDANMIFVDAGLNRVGIGQGSPAFVFDVDGDARVDNLFKGRSTTDSAGSFVVSNGNSTQFSSAAFWDTQHASYAGGIHLVGRTSYSGTVSIAGVIDYWTYSGSSFTREARIGWNEYTFNEAARDADFRVESASNSNAIYLDASAGVLEFGQSSNLNTVPLVAVRGLHDAHTHLWAAHTSTNFFASNLYINRESNDGRLVDFRQANITEGTIEVSGSTVSYNGFSGNHESSGIPTTTPIGTVVSTIDELDVYVNGSKQGQTRKDHAKVKVSNTMSDPAVYGVVSRFNENDKVIVTSVGIGSILVTGSCAKGDLLESNGDGTAKVQSDDVVRSKTIGKVTIGNSDTGVKLVSCVMYCG